MVGLSCLGVCFAAVGTDSLEHMIGIMECFKQQAILEQNVKHFQFPNETGDFQHSKNDLKKKQKNITAVAYSSTQQQCKCKFL